MSYLKPLSTEIGMYKDEELSFSKLLDISTLRGRINVIYWNRQELFNAAMEENLNNTYTGQEILDMVERIERDNPMIFGGRDE